MSWLRRLTNTLRTGTLRHDIDRELAFHVAEREDELRAAGASEAESRRLARLRFRQRRCRDRAHPRRRRLPRARRLAA